MAPHFLALVERQEGFPAELLARKRWPLGIVVTGSVAREGARPEGIDFGAGVVSGTALAAGSAADPDGQNRRLSRYAAHCINPD